MKSHNFTHKIGRIVAALFFVFSIGFVSSTAVQAQWWPQNRDRVYRRDRDRDYRRDDDWRYRRGGQYGNIQQAFNQGYQDGIYTGSRDAQRRQSYNPQRSHFYRNGHGDNDYSRRQARNNYQYQQAYRQGFVRGYDEGFRRYGGYNRNRRGTYNRFPFPW